MRHPDAARPGLRISPVIVLLGVIALIAVFVAVAVLRVPLGTVAIILLLALHPLLHWVGGHSHRTSSSRGDTTRGAEEAGQGTGP